ncbi:DUF4245 family protein [Austwickia sp. TVS 96-490-7B]|uniref:DUF4245 family protein n=1 Tax=Austwickia sp. TVS 96-490-7B TaxID=2830843 RepID=UPI002104746B|nr:DUF4245 family protein [Austwickia sp. TVS 96-490-7B]
MAVFVLGVVALLPRPAARERVSVDVGRTAQQIAADKGWPLATADLGDAWHPTSVSFAPDSNGVPTWLIGYHHRPGDDQYVVLSQTRPGDGLDAGRLATWLDRQTRQGQPDGESTIAGTRWQRRSVDITSGGTVHARRSLVITDNTAPAGLATVISGDVDYPTLEQVAAALRTTPAQPTPSAPASPTSGSATPSPTSAPGTDSPTPSGLRSASAWATPAER